MMIFQPGNLPVIGTRRDSGSRVIDRTVYVKVYYFYDDHLLHSVMGGVFLCNRKSLQSM